MVSPRTFFWIPILLTSLALAQGCVSYSEPAQESEDWSAEWSEKAANAAKATARGAANAASATGDALGTAFHGVANGFADPDAEAFGAYPKGYADTIRKHMWRFEGVPKEASFQFGKPERGYINKGILAGGGVAWQGYLVEVAIHEDTLFDSQAKPDEYVVRLTDGEVEEVLEAEYADALNWAERQETEGGAEPPPANHGE